MSQNDFENTTCKQNSIIYELKIIKTSLAILTYKVLFVLGWSTTPIIHADRLRVLVY